MVQNVSSVCLYEGIFSSPQTEGLYVTKRDLVLKNSGLFFRGTGVKMNLYETIIFFTRPSKKYDSLLTNFSMFPKRTGTKF